MSAVASIIGDTFKTLFKGPKIPSIDIPGTPAVPKVSDAALSERRRRAGAVNREGFEANILSGNNLGTSLPPAQTAGRPLNATGGVKPNLTNILGG